MATKLLALTCIRKERFNDRYPVVRKHLTRSRGGSSSETAVLEIDEAISRAVFQVLGMTCSACAGSVEKAIKRLPGIHEAVIDALNNRAHILFYPNFVDVSYDLSQLNIRFSLYCSVTVNCESFELFLRRLDWDLGFFV